MPDLSACWGFRYLARLAQDDSTRIASSSKNWKATGSVVPLRYSDHFSFCNIKKPVHLRLAVSARLEKKEGRHLKALGSPFLQRLSKRWQCLVAAFSLWPCWPWQHSVLGIWAAPSWDQRRAAAAAAWRSSLWSRSLEGQRSDWDWLAVHCSLQSQLMLVSSTPSKTRSSHMLCPSALPSSGASSWALSSCACRKPFLSEWP